MKPKYTDISAIKKLYSEMIKYKDDPKLKDLVKSNRQNIDYNLKFYEYTEETFAKENSFCVECGHSLNQDNKCIFCGKEYGWA